MVAESGK